MLYRRNLPHLEEPGRTYFITFHTMDDFMLPDAAKSLVLNHCLYDDGKRYTLHAVVVLRTHVHLLLTPLPDGAGSFRLAEIMGGIKGASVHSVNKASKKGWFFVAGRIIRSYDPIRRGFYRQAALYTDECG